MCDNAAVTWKIVVTKMTPCDAPPPPSSPVQTSSPRPRCSQTDAARMRCAEVGLAEGGGVWVDNRCFQTD